MSRVAALRQQQAAIWQAAQQRWRGAREEWRDAAAVAFEQQYWNEWEELMPRFLNALSLLEESLGKVVRHSQQ